MSEEEPKHPVLRGIENCAVCGQTYGPLLATYDVNGPHITLCHNCAVALVVEIQAMMPEEIQRATVLNFKREHAARLVRMYAELLG